jgi:L-malate glycosyltransferase
MRIFHVISGDLWAGAEVQVYHTLSALKKEEGVSVACILFNDGNLKDNLERCGIRAILFDEGVFSSFELLKKLTEVFQKERPDIVHVHAVKEHFITKVASILSRSSIPLVRTVHGSAGVSRNLPLKQRLRSRLVVNLDHLLIKYFSNVVIAVSKDLEQKFLSQKISGEVHQIYNAIDALCDEQTVTEDIIRMKYGAQNCFWIGTAARLVEVKNLQMLIRAGLYLEEKQIPFKISIFGEGPLQKELQKIIDENTLQSRIKFCGFQPDIMPIIRSFDVFVLCSFHEGLPMALLEAMLCKTPVVCTSVGGMKEIIEHNVHGLLVKSDDSNELAGAFITLYQNKGLAKQLSENACKLVQEEFTVKNITTHLLDVYMNLLGEDRRQEYRKKAIKIQYF